MARSISITTGLRVSSLLMASALVALTGCSSDEEGDGRSSDTTGSGSGSGASGAGGSGASSSTASSSSASSSTTGSGGDAPGGAGTGGDSSGGSGGVGTGGSSTGGGGTGGTMMVQDADGDGWTVADGDCCDQMSIACAEPAKVNPGAFEYLGNQVDDDCDPTTADNVAPADCGGAPLATPTTGDELARAMDLCQSTTESPPLPQKKWGVISASLSLADGTATAPNDLQVGVLGDYGTNVKPKKNATMASISSGTARALGDPGYVHPQNGGAGQIGNYNAGTQAGVPPAWLAANGGALPPPTSCPACTGANCTKAFDSVNLKVRIRVPTNALSFSYNFKFYTAEYPEYVCQQYNDFFVTLLTSTEPSIPADKNIAFDALGNEVSVNNGFLDVCFGCSGGTLDLIGNGMGGWASGEVDEGGGTNWLTNEAPVVPGETIEIEFVTWDAADHNVDSLVLIDNFRWDLDPSTVGTHE